jgi:DNA-binding transcriptional LysR family regulator
MNLNALEDFRLVASHGGLGSASRASGRSKATLSRRIADLEDALGIRLLERGANRLTVTDAGKLLLARTEDPMRDVAEAVTAAREGAATPRGHLRIAAPLLFSQLAFGKLAARFLATYPEVQLEVVSEDRAVDLVEEHFDVAIRVNPREDSALVGRCFAKDRLVVTAAPSVKMPRQGKAGRRARVPAVMLASFGSGPWSIDGRRLIVDPQPVLTASSLLVVHDAVLAGVGAGLLPLSMIRPNLERDELVQWGPTGSPVELWVLHTSRRLPSPKVRALVDFMSAQYPDGTFALPG